MKVSQSIAVSVSSFLFLGMMTLSAGIALAQSGGDGEVRLSAKMLSGTASGKADYRERGNRRRLNVEVENLPNTTPSPKAIFVNGVWVGNMTFATCPIPAQQLLCGEMELNTQDGQATPVVTGGQIIQVGLSPAILAGTF
jgi:hypothetical protein